MAITRTSSPLEDMKYLNKLAPSNKPGQTRDRSEEYKAALDTVRKKYGTATRFDRARNQALREQTDSYYKSMEPDELSETTEAVEPVAEDKPKKQGLMDFVKNIIGSPKYSPEVKEERVEQDLSAPERPETKTPPPVPTPKVPVEKPSAGSIDAAKPDIRATMPDIRATMPDIRATTKTHVQEPVVVEESRNPGSPTRQDGSKKSQIGFLGPIPNKYGEVMTEFSTDMDWEGNSIEIPTLVPTLSNDEIEHLKSKKGGEGWDLKNSVERGILNKARQHARERIEAGKSPFYDDILDGKKVTHSEASEEKGPKEEENIFLQYLTPEQRKAYDARQSGEPVKPVKKEPKETENIFLQYLTPKQRKSYNKRMSENNANVLRYNRQ